MSPTLSSYLLSIFLVLLLLLLLLLSPSGGGDDAPNDLIDAVCKNASRDNMNEYMTYEFCVTTLQTDPESQNATFEGLGLIALKLAKTKMTNLKSYTENLLKYNTSNDSYLKEPLEDCVEIYSNGIHSAKVATVAYKDRDYDTSNIHMSAAFDSAFNCEDGFNEKGVESPLKDRNQAMTSFNELALYFTHQLSQKGDYLPTHN